jgi:hypothetical protein
LVLAMNRLDTLVGCLAKDDQVRTQCQKPLPPEYDYASLSTMLLDAIFSIGIHYGQVKALVARPMMRRGAGLYPGQQVVTTIFPIC